MKRIVMLVALLVSTTAQAEPTLLAEFGRTAKQDLRHQLPYGDPRFEWLFFGLTVPNAGYSSLGVPIGWATTPPALPAPGFRLGDVIPIDVQAQPTSIISIWTCDNCYTPFLYSNGLDLFAFSANELFAGIDKADGYPGFGLFGHALVPQLGDGFAGYTITSAELTVTQVAPPVWGYVVKLYGEVTVPEPASYLLVLVACCLTTKVRTRTNG